jgi:hypothetical protein
MHAPIHRRKIASSPEARSSTDVILKDSSISKSKDTGVNVSRLWYISVAFVCIFAGSRYFRADDSKPSSQLLRESSSVASNEAAVDVSMVRSSEPPKIAPALKVEPIKPASVVAHKSSMSSGKLCGRDLPFDLWDESTWPTPYTPSYFEQEPPESKTQAVLIKNVEAPTYEHLDDKFRVIGDFFAALDLAYEKKCQVYITKDASWFWDTLTKLFFDRDLVKDDDFWRNMQGRLGVIIIKDEAEAKALGKELTIISPNQQPKVRSLTAEQVRNRRDTVFRKLIQLAFDKEVEPHSCYAFQLWGLDNHYAVSKYIVLSPDMSKTGLSKFNSVSGKEHKRMTAQHVKSTLTKLQIHDKKDMIFIRGDRSKTDHEEMKALLDDPELNTYGAEKETDEYEDDEMLYVAILAGVFIADPSQWSLMVARIRFALGFRNTFVLTETKTVDAAEGETLVSYVNDNNYLELYDREHLGPWMG